MIVGVVLFLYSALLHIIGLSSGVEALSSRTERKCGGRWSNSRSEFMDSVLQVVWRHLVGAEKLNLWLLGDIEIRERVVERDVVRMTIVT